MTSPIFCALDVPSPDGALALARSVRDHVGGFKLGLEYFCANGPQGVAVIKDLGLPIFLDLKLHDIPETVARAVRAVAGLGASYLTLHAQGGPAMLEAAASAALEFGHQRPRLLAVTVLTSLDAPDLMEIGVRDALEQQVARLARLAARRGADGIVCSPREIAAVRQAIGPDRLIVTPGIRPAGADKGDQKRTMSPREALGGGADILVIGRPITAADDPAEAARAIAPPR